MPHPFCFLQTLPARELNQGFAEIIKHGIIADAEMFASLREKRITSGPELPQLVKRNIEIKVRIVSEDERDRSGKRAILNFGHTFGHAIENALGYGEWLHGEAVAAGMVLAADMSRRLSWFSDTDYQRILRLYEEANLPIQAPHIGAEKARQLMCMDKKVLNGQLRLVLLQGLGNAVVTADYPPDAFQQTLQQGFG